MARFVPKDKLSKKAQKELNRQRRMLWDFSPVSRTVDSRKVYNRKKRARDRYDTTERALFYPQDHCGAHCDTNGIRAAGLQGIDQLIQERFFTKCIDLEEDCLRTA